MRVLHFVPYYPPERVGGVGHFAAVLHEGLRRRGLESAVVTRGRGPAAPGVHRIAASRWGWFIGTLRYARAAATCDVVHCQSGEALPVMLAVRLWPGRRARILATFHVGQRGLVAAERPYLLEGRRFGRGGGAALRARLHGWVDALALRLADASNAISRATARDLLGPGRGDAMPVLYNPLPPARDSAVAPAEPVELFYAGIASHRKRVPALAFVLRAVREQIPDARLRVAGFRWQDAPELAALCDEFGLRDAVECLGVLPPEALPRLHRAARLLVVPSAYEGLPYVIVEALREGTPVVATRVSGHPEVIEDGVSGRLVPPDDPRALAEACVELLRDSAARDRMGEAGRRRVAERFDAERQIDAYVDYYRALSGDPARPLSGDAVRPASGDTARPASGDPVRDQETS